MWQAAISILLDELNPLVCFVLLLTLPVKAALVGYTVCVLLNFEDENSVFSRYEKQPVRMALTAFRI